MKITNILHFTDHHRFAVSRSFSLGSLTGKMLSSIYQPMIGAGPVALYHTLHQQLPADKAGYSSLEQQRKLFLLLELEPGEKGRKQFIEWSSKLEAVGLLSTSRRLFLENEEYVYEYRLYEPLPPDEFFRNQHLVLLLRDKVGKIMLLQLRQDLLEEEPKELGNGVSEQLSVPFYDLFRLNTRIMDHELEQALYEAAAGGEKASSLDTESQSFTYTDIISRFPKASRNRPFVEALQFRKDHLVAINIAKSKYNLALQETCRLLDEDGIFDEEGNLQFEELQYRANLLYRQTKRREEFADRKVHRIAEEANSASVPPEVLQPEPEKNVEMEFYLEVPPLFQGQCDVHQYNMLLRNQPYTLVLKKFFPQGTVPDGVLDIFERIDLNYGLSEEVINVLIHFLHTDRRSWAKSSIEAVASDLLGKQVATYEQAVEYIREKARYKARAAAAKRKAETAPAGGNSGPGGRGGGGRGKQKPVIPVATDKPARKQLSDEEMEAIIRKASRWEEGKGSV